MITLTTGLPGACKTLYTLSYVSAKAKKESRPVFYNGINFTDAGNVALGWTEFDAVEKWFELPEGSIIVVDECQRNFRPRSNGSKVPAYVEELETHRHRGYDIFLITQHPMLVDGNVRRLAGQHFHSVRKFGMQWSTIHEWQQVKESCDKLRKDSVRHEFKFPKEMYDWYKSATVHTHKARIPMRVWLLIAMPLLVIGCFFFFRHWHQQRLESSAVVTSSSRPAQEVAPSTVSTSFPVAEQSYLEARRPVVPGLALTAPAYADLVKPSRVPVPAACGLMRGKCSCYTQQATRIADMPDNLCRSIVENGFFEDFDPGDRRDLANGHVGTRSYSQMLASSAVN
jgi:zona occludens toxin